MMKKNKPGGSESNLDLTKLPGFMNGQISINNLAVPNTTLYYMGCTGGSGMRELFIIEIKQV